MFPETSYRYFEEWKELPRDLESTNKSWRKELKNDSGFSDHLVDLLDEDLDMTKEAVITRKIYRVIYLLLIYVYVVVVNVVINKYLQESTFPYIQ